jgi:alpha-L-arabinofuranosidase
MANLAQMVNAIAPVVTTGQAAAIQPIYYPVLMHAQAALDVAADVHVTGPTIGPPGPGRHSRWSHRVADLGPFDVIDAAATASADRRRIAVMLINRSENEPESADIVLRDAEFDGPATIRIATAERDRGLRTLPDVAGVNLDEGTEAFRGAAVSVQLPPQSFTVIEAATTR